LPRFLGIDFGWDGKPSGLACLEWTGSWLRLWDLRCETPMEAILAWVDEHADPDTVIGIDAPTVIPNETGMRVADKLAHSRYGKYHAGCYPASRARTYWKRTTGLSLDLRKRGFRHGDQMTPRARGRFQIEVHPHAATVQLNELDRIVKYKRGRLAERRLELGRLRQFILDRMPTLTPRLILPDLPEIPMKGLELKAVEDQLDAITCAYVAAHWWYWGLQRNEVLGNSEEGYIVVPKRQTKQIPLADLRENYAKGGLNEEDLAASPFAQFERWFSDARAASLKEPNAMTLATATPDGHPSARIVLLKGMDSRGFVFYTNYESQKGRELEANPHAALVFYWPELERQVRISGVVARVSREESRLYFHSRPVGSQIGALASKQSETIPSREPLQARMAALEAEFAGKTVPLPDSWGGYRLKAESIEFWQGRPSRLHDRLRYVLQADKSWKIDRLSP
jgi:pyridoxamine 5'-phosphate oxidase